MREQKSELPHDKLILIFHYCIEKKKGNIGLLIPP